MIVHVTQQPPAEATIFWDNSFAANVSQHTHTHTHGAYSLLATSFPTHHQDREPFVIPESIPWPRLSEALNCYFHANTGRGLTPPNLDYLGRKLLGVGEEKNCEIAYGGMRVVKNLSFKIYRERQKLRFSS